MMLGIFGWLICGAILGFIATKFVDLHGDDPRIGIAVAALGGGIGGWMYSLISGSPVSGFNGWSLICAAAVAVVAVVPWHIVRGRGTHAAPTIRRSY